MIHYISNKVFTLDLGPNMVMGFDEGDNVILFDTGIDDSIGRKIDKFIGKRVSLIVNSHSHADHIGGNSYFQKKYNSKVFAEPGELSFINNTELETSLLNGGFWEYMLADKFLKAKGSIPEPIDKGFLSTKGIEVLDLPGHSPSLIGLKIDKIVYLGDALFSGEVIKKYGVLYLYDVDRFEKSLSKIEELTFEKAVICHKGLYDKEVILDLIHTNRNHTETMKSLILENLQFNTDYEITEKIIHKLSIEPNLTIYMLILSTMRSYLSFLQKTGAVEMVFDRGVRWKRR
ncbi:MAG: MBL fold metallo-hydrolase [Calditerrivibrio sp.]